MRKWKITIRKNSTGFYASGKHGNSNKVFSMKGYNRKASLIHQVEVMFPGNHKIVDLTLKKKK